jgi:hypothetical protein
LAPNIFECRVDRLPTQMSILFRAGCAIEPSKGIAMEEVIECY